jgi:hypothetical protein
MAKHAISTYVTSATTVALPSSELNYVVLSAGAEQVIHTVGSTIRTAYTVSGIDYGADTSIAELADGTFGDVFHLVNTGGGYPLKVFHNYVGTNQPIILASGVNEKFETSHTGGWKFWCDGEKWYAFDTPSEAIGDP